MQDDLKDTTFLIFHVGPYQLSAPADAVQGIITPPPVTALPFCPPAVVGTFVFRDHAIPAISLRLLFGVSAQNNESGQLIVAETNMGLRAFWVDIVDELAQEKTQAPHFETAPADNPFCHKLFVRDKEIYLHTSFDLLAKQCEFSRGKMVSASGSFETTHEESTAIPVPPKKEAEKDKSEQEPPPGVPKESVHRSPLVHRARIAGENAKYLETIPHVEAPHLKRHLPPAVQKKRKKAAPLVSRGILPPQARESEQAPPPLQTGKRRIVAALTTLLLLLTSVAVILFPVRHQENEQPVGKEAVRSYEPVPVRNMPKPQPPSAEQANKPPPPSREKAPGPVNNEILRVETEEFTVTVERPQASPPPQEMRQPNSPAGQPVAPPEQTPVPDEVIHRVKTGDTLWDISEKYLGNPFLYKKIAEQSNIENPHWIYPGDIIRIVRKKERKKP